MIRPSNSALSDAQSTAHEQLAAAWQLQIEHIQEVLAATWPEQVSRILEERLADLAARLDEERAVALNYVRREVTSKLNQAARRLRTFEGEAQWSKVFVDATQSLCERAALFTINGQRMRLQAARGFEIPEQFEDVPVASAPAFANAVESKDSIVAVRTAGELSPPIAGFLGEAADQKCALFPIVTRDRVAAVLYADGNGGSPDSDALELLATFAGLVLDTQAGVSGSKAGIVRIATPNHRAANWASLTREEQELHLKAQRFARVQVAQMKLYHAQAVKNGRTTRDLYTSLKEEIDFGRESFRNDFLTGSPTMVDYLHLELVRALANDDAELLGPRYPGPLA